MRADLKNERTSLAESFAVVRKRGAKFATVSLGATVFSQALLFLLTSFLSGRPNISTQLAWTSANVLAVIASGIPSFYLNRRWVWEKEKGGVNIKREVLPFWGFAFAGLILSTITVALTANVTDNRLFVNAANLTVFGALWVIKLFVFDKKVFGPAASKEKQ